MSVETVLFILIIGAVAGWLAGVVMRGFGFGLVGNIVVGICGGFIGTWLLTELKVGMPGGPILSAILTAFIGSVALLAVIGVLRSIGRTR